MAIKFSTKPLSGPVSVKDGKSASPADAQRPAADGVTDLFEPDAGKPAAKAKARKKK